MIRFLGPLVSANLSAKLLLPVDQQERILQEYECEEQHGSFHVDHQWRKFSLGRWTIRTNDRKEKCKEKAMRLKRNWMLVRDNFTTFGSKFGITKGKWQCYISKLNTGAQPQSGDRKGYAGCGVVKTEVDKTEVDKTEVDKTEVCSQKLDKGTRGFKKRLQKRRFYWNGSQCKPFLWTTFGGNDNRFRTRKQCLKKCGQKVVKTEPTLGDWTADGQCSATCGTGVQNYVRSCTGNDAACLGETLIKTESCHDQDCVDPTVQDCKILEKIWRDDNDDTCDDYVTKQYCTADGAYGPGLDDSWTETFGDYENDGHTAWTACCGCGAGVDPTVQDCKIVEQTWEDSDDDTCNTYVRHQWCTADGEYGPGHTGRWSFDEKKRGGHTALTACCGCGAGRKTDIEKTDIPTLGDWTADGQCSATCGTGVQNYVRICTGNEAACSGETLTKTESCHDQDCPLEWKGKLGECDKTCGSSSRGYLTYELQCMRGDSVLDETNCWNTLDEPGLNPDVECQEMLPPCEKTDIEKTDIVDPTVQDCKILEKSWFDSYGSTCDDYVTGKDCTADGEYGPAYNHNWTFEEFKNNDHTALTACCGCGAGLKTDIES